MKRTITLFALAIALTVFTACNDTKKDSAIETALTPDAAKGEAFAFADKFHEAFKKKDTKAIKEMTTNTGLYMGTDKTEVFSQDSFIQYLDGKLGNPAIGTIEYKIDRREVVIDEDGHSVIINDEFIPIVFTQNIPWRMTARAIKKDGFWKFDFISFAMTPSNDVVPAVNAAAYQGE